MYLNPTIPQAIFSQDLGCGGEKKEAIDLNCCNSILYRFNMLDQRLGNYVPVMKDVVRDLVVHPENQAG